MTLYQTFSYVDTGLPQTFPLTGLPFGAVVSSATCLFDFGTNPPNLNAVQLQDNAQGYLDTNLSCADIASPSSQPVTNIQQINSGTAPSVTITGSGTTNTYNVNLAIDFYTATSSGFDSGVSFNVISPVSACGTSTSSPCYNQVDSVNFDVFLSFVFFLVGLWWIVWFIHKK